MPIKRTYIFMTGILLPVGLLLATAVMGQEGNDSEPVDLDEIQEDAVRDLFDENGRMVNTDQRLARIAWEYESGFGVYYFHDTDKRTAYVYMLDPSQAESAEASFRAAYGGKRQVTRVIPVQGDYAFDDLLEWFYVLDGTLVREGIHPATGAVLEIANRIQFRLRDMKQAKDARRIMDELGIPAGAVIFHEAQNQLLSDEDSVNAKWRTLVSGIQHKIKYGPAYWTIGLVTERNTVNGMVVASQLHQR